MLLWSSSFSSPGSFFRNECHIRIVQSLQSSVTVAGETMTRAKSLHGPDGPPRNHDIVQVQMQILRCGPGAAVINVDPDRLDLELGDVTKTQVGALASRPAVDPGLEDAVLVARFAVLPQRVELAVHFDAVPAIVLQGRVE